MFGVQICFPCRDISGSDTVLRWHPNPKMKNGQRNQPANEIIDERLCERQWSRTIEFCAGLDVSLESTSICVMDGEGKVAREAKLPSEPDAIGLFLAECVVQLKRIGLGAFSFSRQRKAGGTCAGASGLEYIASCH